MINNAELSAEVINPLSRGKQSAENVKPLFGLMCLEANHPWILTLHQTIPYLPKINRDQQQQLIRIMHGTESETFGYPQKLF